MYVYVLYICMYMYISICMYVCDMRPQMLMVISYLNHNEHVNHGPDSNRTSVEIDLSNCNQTWQ